jgi:hypothetical protein
LAESGFAPRVDHDLETFAETRAALADPRWSKLAEPCDPDLNPDASPADTFVVCPSSEQSGRFEAAANGGFGASWFAV